MSVLSIRSMPKFLEKAIVQEAKKSGKTKTEIVLEALMQKFKKDPLEERNKKLREWAGQLSQEDYEEFQKNIQFYSKVDEEMWK